MTMHPNPEDRHLSRDELNMGHDLQKKCAHDVITACKRVVDLCDNHAMATYVSVGGVIGAAGHMMAMLADGPEFLDRYSGEEIHDFVLFAMMFAWVCDHRTHKKGGVDQILPRTIAMWEAVTGKTFDLSWLLRPMRETLE